MMLASRGGEIMGWWLEFLPRKEVVGATKEIGVKEKAGREKTPDVVICGAGIAGISAAYHLSVRHGVRNVILVDERPPLTLTSDKSTECYRNFWPGPGDAMVSLMNRSIDLLEELARETGNAFHLSRRGYLYCCADLEQVPNLRRAAEESAALGAGPLRCHDGKPSHESYIPPDDRDFDKQPTGIDLITEKSLIERHFPYLSEKVLAVLHARRCGWFSVQQLGMLLLEKARQRGVRLLSGKIRSVDIVGNRIQAVRIERNGALERIPTKHFVLAAGPLLKEVGRTIGLEFPVFSELHLKIAFKDSHRIVPRRAPMLIGTDPIVLPWSEEERKEWASSEGTRKLLGPLPSGVHTRPEGGLESIVLLGLWPYDVVPVEPVFPFPIDPHYPEMVLRGLATIVPGLQRYVEHLPQAVVDGGYYTKTRENRPLIGKLPVEGAYVIGALSGFGVMAACGAGELLASHVTAGPLPHYASAFAFERYEDPHYQQLLKEWEQSGQL